METHVKILGVLYIVFHVFGLLLAFLAFAVLSGIGLFSGDEEAFFIMPLVGSAVSCVLFVLSFPGVIGGIGLLYRKGWARVLVLVLGVLSLLEFPFGTLLGIYTLWVLLQRETDQVFSTYRTYD